MKNDDISELQVRWQWENGGPWTNWTSVKTASHTFGTSGEKAVMNGVMNFSVLDGWWAEGYLPGAGWAIEEEDMKAIAYDVGFQLGRGHPKYLYEPYDVEARRKLLILLDEFREDLGRTMLDLTEQTITAWRKFRAEVMKQKSHNRE